MPEFEIKDPFRKKLSSARLGILECTVQAGAASDELLAEINKELEGIRVRLRIEDVSQVSLIRQTKEAYRILGKDPSRYRPSAEALTRRILRGKDLYRINNIVDLLNLASLKTGFSIGGYDAGKITGKVRLDTGIENEPYQAIGRGNLNIDQLPVLRDDTGPFGSPTSDSERTMVTGNTHNFLMVFFDFYADDLLPDALGEAAGLLEKYGHAGKIRTAVAD